MEYTESKADETDAGKQGPQSNSPYGSNARQSDNRSNDTESMWPYTAIERQIAAAATLGDDLDEGISATAHSHNLRRKADRPKTRWFGLGSFLFLFWLLLIGLIVTFTDFDRVLEKMASQVRITEKIADSGSSSTSIPGPASTPSTSPQTPLASSPSQTTTAQVPPTASDSAPTSASSSIATIPAPAKTPVPAKTPAPAPAASATITHDNAASSPATPANDVLSIPIADISLRNRPELVEQLAQVYRAQLATNPNDTATRAALERLQERSLADIQALVAEGYVSTASRSLETVSLLFPELAGNARYKYLVELTNYMRRDMQEPVKTAQAAAIAPQQNSTSKKLTETVKTERAKTENKNAEAAISTKPEIRSVSIMPGVKTDGRFVPRDGGNVFMVELSYSNFAKAFVESNQATLTVLLGIPDDPLVLAEVPVTISADRGTKSFMIETNGVQGYAGGQFQLNFMLNDEFLTSRTLRLSRPR